MAEKAQKQMLTDIFVGGAREGWNMGVGSIIPNVMMAFIVIKALSITGAMELFGNLFAPLMGLFGVPGEGAAVLMASFMSAGGGVGVMMSLFADGVLSGEHLAILAPANYLMGSTVQYAGRLLGVVSIEARFYPIMFGLVTLNGFIAMLLMRVLI
ncbi:YjiG family protein [Endozoicomonas lisbonensis]|uniref:Spore maturation protein SpmB n=1 Tax=Endozoicomonas lisbonensis TaxID=3120522 RepID=A0ABV2SIV5_9GAMM